jgi:hypothetical protein
MIYILLKEINISYVTGCTNHYTPYNKEIEHILTFEEILDHKHSGMVEQLIALLNYFFFEINS